jgi:hypothetical protein
MEKAGAGLKRELMALLAVGVAVLVSPRINASM